MRLNQDILKKVYADYKSKGFEIYSVALDTDKALWASIVKNQELDWVNVCDGYGLNSSSVALYGVSTLPCSYFIVGDQISAAAVSDEASLRAFLNKNL
ncbi:MAG: thioredoxin family protein [Bacteroidales bacterium]|nr:thioredoxin family protein [Bacteroidales bacterium]